MGAFFDLIQKRQLEGDGERQLYCRLYDGGQWVSSIGVKKSEGREETTNNCVCIYGFLQPQPFLEKVYPQLLDSDDGFVDRLLVSIPKTHVLMEEEVDEWCTKLQAFTLTSLQKPFQLIADWHSQDREHIYSFSEEGSSKVYRVFADEMAQAINDQWESGHLAQGNMSKDKRTMIRLCGLLHVFFKAMNECLGPETQTTEDSQDESDDGIPPLPQQLPPLGDIAVTPSPCITEEEAEMAVILTEYFQEEGRCVNKGWQMFRLKKFTAVFLKAHAHPTSVSMLWNLHGGGVVT